MTILVWNSYFFYTMCVTVCTVLLKVQSSILAPKSAKNIDLLLRSMNYGNIFQSVADKKGKLTSSLSVRCVLFRKLLFDTSGYKILLLMSIFKKAVILDSIKWKCKPKCNNVVLYTRNQNCHIMHICKIYIKITLLHSYQIIIRLGYSKVFEFNSQH